MTSEELTRRLEAGEIVRLPVAVWDAVGGSFEEVARHDTKISGDIVVLRSGNGWAAVEEPAAGERVIRRLADADAVRRFIEGRMEAYDRMWDGCGCRIDYDA